MVHENQHVECFISFLHFCLHQVLNINLFSALRILTGIFMVLKMLKTLPSLFFGFSLTRPNTPTSKVHQPSYPGDGHLPLSGSFTELENRTRTQRWGQIKLKYWSLNKWKRCCSVYHLFVFLHVCFLAVFCFIHVRRRQPPHRWRVVLVEQPGVSGEQLARPVPVDLPGAGSSAAGSLSAVHTSNEAAAETSSHRRVPVNLSRCDSVDLLPFAERLLEDKTWLMSGC